MEVDSTILALKLILYNLVPRCLFLMPPAILWRICYCLSMSHILSSQIWRNAKLQLDIVWVTDRQWKTPKWCTQSYFAFWSHQSPFFSWQWRKVISLHFFPQQWLPNTQILLPWQRMQPSRTGIWFKMINKF